jgi:hypothetical protein
LVFKNSQSRKGKFQLNFKSFGEIFNKKGRMKLDFVKKNVALLIRLINQP